MKGVDSVLTFYMTSVAGGTDRPLTEQLIECIGNGDRQALERLYEETHRALYAYALSVLKHTQDAQDVLHDAYMAVVTHAATYRAQGKPMAWMTTIVRNLCIQRLRERNKTTAADAWDMQTGIGEWEHTAADNRVVLVACMERLSDEERQIVVLHAVTGLPHRQIASMMSLKLSTVLSKYHRALKKLRNELEGGSLHEKERT